VQQFRSHLAFYDPTHYLANQQQVSIPFVEIFMRVNCFLRFDQRIRNTKNIPRESMLRRKLSAYFFGISFGTTVNGLNEIRDANEGEAKKEIA
jgi:hypothetical protein